MRFGSPLTHKEKLAALAQWHDFYPLIPRFIKGAGYVCFEVIERKAVLSSYGTSFQYWEYRVKETK